MGTANPAGSVPTELIARLLRDEESGWVPDDSRIAAFLQHVLDAEIELIALHAAPGRPPGGLMLALPGGAGILMLPPIAKADADEAAALCRAGVRAATERGFFLVQGLVSSEQDLRADAFVAAGLARLTRLVYLEGGVEPPRGEGDPRFGWTPYSSESHAHFCATLLATYEQSRDCPELTGLRPVEQVLASHRAAGPFDPSLWEMLIVNGRPAGCLLLSRLSGVPVVEVVYVGLRVEQRGRGLGRVLLDRALRQAWRAGAIGMTIVADERNTVALRLYQSFGLKAVTTRAVYWRDLARQAGDSRAIVNNV